ncbi:YqgE/AlgH family protein [Mangrovimonas sp. AS39]|uniref:YqgE/AlgH family protein n=1 Tax=Mangrovimonas TaxID=1211036 RepID=UPI0006B67606|nr:MULTISPECIES: YqgE/AlgH family protein [Mangrovimonas]MCF1192334.1 YqgE/AlgH family protein [Mangrovimonas futianensis]MCF1195917.1 YqgE/AlgH family protein [Mangrovimonas futianensis]MCF1423183.1 YqgE/AlgH family protein [Mangrovimonas futianensis]NIK93238.1 YqgE/AlgH family protein [Mangrovimonas sp. CR14]
MTTIKPKKGCLLIAEPTIIGDISFNRSIILLADHNDEGSIGFILNKPLDYTIKDLIPEIKADFKIYNGGPVEQDNLYFIHKIPDLIPNSIEISMGIYWGGDFDRVAELIANNEIEENNIRFFLGYSGWASEQLNDELKSNSWVVTENIYENSIIEKDYESFWKEKMLEFGDDYSIWSNAPENPSFN